MGLISIAIAYKVGKRRGRRTTSSPVEVSERGIVVNRDGTVDECSNYERFCRNFGSCDGQICEFD